MTLASPPYAMPNALAHFGLQTLTSSAMLKRADVRWIGLGCLIPDIPWMLQRLVQPFAAVDLVDLRLYVAIQSSLFFCLLLAAAISLQAESSMKTFLLLATNSLLHLLLDPLEVKWGNGTLLFAPFSWHMTSLAWFWPEEIPSLLLTLIGLLVFPAAAWMERKREIRLVRDRKRQAAGILLLLVYLLLPPFLFRGPMEADVHFAATLQDQHRNGKMIAFDRRPFSGASQTLFSHSGEHLQLVGSRLPDRDGIISVQGRFVGSRTIMVSAWRLHDRMRDCFSEIGIFLLSAVWLVALCAKRITISSSG